MVTVLSAVSHVSHCSGPTHKCAGTPVQTHTRQGTGIRVYKTVSPLLECLDVLLDAPDRLDQNIVAVNVKVLAFVD
jgi:hypothetical protein